MALEPKPLGQQSPPPPPPPQGGNEPPQNNQGGDQGAQGDGSQPPAKPTRPEWLPESHWDPEGGAIKPEFGEYFNQLATSYQAQADRNALIPKTPDEYDLSLPADLQLPEGIAREDFAIDTAAPEFKAFKEILHSEKVTPEAAKKFVGLLAQREAAQVARINGRVAEEQKALGGNYGERVAAVGQFLEGRLGKDSAAAVLRGVFTATQVKAFEALAAQFSGQGVANIPGKGSEPGQDPQKIEGWDKMTFEEKRAHQHALKAG